MYSQNSEEIVILNYFHLQEIKKGTFIDIGANDGITLSNTRALAELGWSGVLIEPSKEAYKRACENNKNNLSIQIYNCAIGKENKLITFYESGEHLGKGDTSLLSTIVKDELSRWKDETFTENVAMCYDWKYFLEQSELKEFDFISMDIEGMELEVLPQMDLNELKVYLFCVEWNGKNFDFFDNYFKSFGFNLIHQNPENLIYGR
jgi:FkbM family methyltransferase